MVNTLPVVLDLFMAGLPSVQQRTLSWQQLQLQLLRRGGPVSSLDTVMMLQ